MVSLLDSAAVKHVSALWDGPVISVMAHIALICAVTSDSLTHVTYSVKMTSHHQLILETYSGISCVNLELCVLQYLLFCELTCPCK